MSTMNAMKKFFEWIKNNANNFNSCKSEKQNELIKEIMIKISESKIDNETMEGYVMYKDEVQSIPHSYLLNINGDKELLCSDCFIKDDNDIILSIIQDEETTVIIEGRIIIQKDYSQIAIGFYAPLDDEKNEWKFYAESETYFNNPSDNYDYQSELEEKIIDAWEKQIHKAVPEVDAEAIKDSKFDDCF